MKKFITGLNLTLILLLCGPCVVGQTNHQFSIDTDIRAIRNNAMPHFHYKYDDYIQYSPAVVMVGMKACGYKSRTSWGRMLVSDAFSTAIMAAVVNGMKYSVKRMRPDNSRRNSFPSGHTATAFMTATMLHKEYGWRSPWFSIGGYTVAAFTGVSRIMNNRHWMSDVLAGAVIGVGSVHLGYFLAGLIFKDKYLNEDYASPEFFHDPAHRYYDVSLSFARKFILNRISDCAKDRGSYTSVAVNIPIIPRFGASVRAGASSITSIDSNMTAGSYNIYSTTAGVYCNYPFAKCLEAGAMIMAGYGWESVDRGGNFDGTAGLFISLFTGNNFNIKAFAEYELMSSIRPKPSIHSINIGYSASFCW